ncbi:MAG: oligopeptidase A [Pseudomonadota bacterium]
MSNPLLEQHALPPFSEIAADQVEPAIKQLIERNKQVIERLAADQCEHTWESLWEPIEQLDDELAQAWSPVSHLNGVANSDTLRRAYNACLPLLSQYNTWASQHSGLYTAYQQLRDGPSYDALDTAQRKALDNVLRDFRLAGVALSDDKKQEFAQLQERLSELGSQFSDNVLDATNAWSMQVSAEQLKGLPETAMANARQAAERAGVEGYLITLDFPSYYPVLMYCDDPQLREQVYRANCTRASDQGPHAGQWDNSKIIDETLDLRQTKAELLGFANYAELSMATKMAESPQQVMQFLEELAASSRPQALSEWAQLLAFASEEYGVTSLNAWDVSYYSEKLKESRYQVSQEAIRPYLPVDKVLDGLFKIVQKLYGVTVNEAADFDSYHEDVRLFDLVSDNEVIARFYLDLYARADKRGGAWMDNCRDRRFANGRLQIPVAYLVCNFTPPLNDTPALLTHDELTTLFHEFGHGLHHMLTKQSVATISGINGVAWDAVELPSQILENWCWERKALELISGHYKTGEPLPDELLEKMLAARNFQSAMMMVRQLEFALFDLQLHSAWEDSAKSKVQAILDEVRSKVAVLIPPAFNRFQNGFSHIFAGGYAAGYYSYKWAEVLSADAFSRFEEEGIFNEDTGKAFREEILEAGGSKEAMELFVSFRGREPEIAPLLRHSGIVETDAA